MSTQAFGKALRLLNSGDFKHVFDDAPFRASHRLFLILARANHRPVPRLGLVISKKSIRLAVQRNRVKRLIRESFRQHQADLAGLDIVVLSRAGLGELSNAELVQQLESQWQRVLRKYRQQASGTAGSAS